MDSPCLTCKRVRDPQNCENKLCKEWRAWYIEKWEAMRSNVRKSIRHTPITTHGVPLGGRQYASPHRVQAFLERNPCDSCYCPKGMCTTPCQLKIVWEEKKGAVK